MSMNQVDVTIVGGGPCGLFASFYAGIRGMSVRIIDSLPELGGQLAALYPEKYVYDMPGFPKVLAKDLAKDLIAQGLQFNPEVVLEETASELIKTEDGYIIRTASGQELPTKTIIISAGAGAFSPTKRTCTAKGFIMEFATSLFSKTRKSQLSEAEIALLIGASILGRLQVRSRSFTAETFSKLMKTALSELRPVPLK